MSKEVSTKTAESALAFPEINALQVSNSFDQLVAIMPEHKEMLEVVKEALPEIQRSTSLFYKTQSQFMDNMLTVSHMTPLRNLRQILAQMNSTREAIKEAHFKLKKKEVELKQKQREYNNLFKKQTLIEQMEDVKNLKNADDDLKADLLEIEMDEIMSNADNTRGYISGAIRTLANYTNQYNLIMTKHDLKDWNETDFEKEEERYHIMKAFEQALCAARTRHDHSIDEGNMIYLTQIGINGAHAQFEIHRYLSVEQTMLRGNPGDPSKGIPPTPPQAPPHSMYIAFLNNMADHFAGSAKEFAEAKGMSTVSNVALIQTGDNRLLLAQKKEEQNDT